MKKSIKSTNITKTDLSLYCAYKCTCTNFFTTLPIFLIKKLKISEAPFCTCIYCRFVMCAPKKVNRQYHVFK